ncbi:hypothetical protein WMY93_029070 [Mugilogobius chulae]|uniref:Telomere-length maintenance and DNA damage repair domain-containing protein n=1 Tax=Mugilogobius chulae TaxID=88201 RepID=A0AAW0N1Z8_9GOBI
MSLALHDLLVCCRGLESDKATERKKEAERFRRLLRSPDTVQELDRTSGPKVKAPSNSHGMLCSGGPRLKCSELLKHVMEVLQCSYSCSVYGEDYSSLLLKDILSVRKYWCDITSQQWHSILDLFCGLFSSSKSINRVTYQCKAREAPDCYRKFGLSFKCLFEICFNELPNEVCRLGEELLPPLLFVWADMRPSGNLKEEIVEFCQLQICLHHPKGARTQDAGGHAEDWTRWHSQLYSMYDTLVREISDIGSRGKYHTGSRNIALKDSLVQLTADLCHMLFSEQNDVQSLEVTQASFKAIQMGSPAHGAAIKNVE